MRYAVQFSAADVRLMASVLVEDLGPTYGAYLAAVAEFEGLGAEEGSESLAYAQAVLGRIEVAERHLIDARRRTVERLSAPVSKPVARKKDLLEDWKPKKRDLKKSLFLAIVISNLKRIYASERSKVEKKMLSR